MMSGANTTRDMKHTKDISAHWFLWAMIGCVALLIAAEVRNKVLQYGYGEINGAIAFLATFGIGIACYAILVEALTHLFGMIFKSPRHGKNILIDYVSKREGAINDNEARRMAMEQRLITYEGETMAPYLKKEELSRLIDNIAEFWHSSFRPEFPITMAVRTTGLTTTDLMHLGWNIAKPFHKSGAHTAIFLKSVFAEAFSNTEVYTIERKLRSNPNVGVIKIDAYIGSDKKADAVKPAMKEASVPKTADAKTAALSDMMNDDFIENSLINDGDVA